MFSEIGIKQICLAHKEVFVGETSFHQFGAFNSIVCAFFLGIILYLQSSGKWKSWTRFAIIIESYDRVKVKDNTLYETTTKVK